MQRIQVRLRNSRGVFLGAIALGGITGAAALVGGDVGLAIFGFLLLTAFGAYLGLSRSEFAVIGTSDADERQRQIGLEAVGVAYNAVVVVALGGFLWELTRGDGQSGTPVPRAQAAVFGALTCAFATLAVLWVLPLGPRRASASCSRPR